MIKQSEHNELYSLLQEFTKVLEEVQRRLPENDVGDQSFEQISKIIRNADRLYCDVADLI